VGGTGGEDTDAGQGGEGGSVGPVEPTVRGRVIDFLGQPVALVPVTIESTTVTTDAQGQFVIENVPDEYSASLVVTLTGARSGSYAWVYEGLTRRNPTLQVYRGRSDVSKQVRFNLVSGVFGEPPFTSVTFASPDGLQQMAFTSAASERSVNWYGPPSTLGRLHALRWDADAEDLPTAYQAYGTQELTLDSATTSTQMVEVGMAEVDIPSRTISAEVTSATTTDRENYVFVHFASNGAIRVAREYTAGASSSYVVPTLEGADVTVAAAAGRLPGRYSIAHDQVAAGETSVALELPNPPTQIAPADLASMVNAQTNFEWSAGAASPSGVFLLHIEDTGVYRGVFVLTTRTRLPLPSPPTFNLRANTEHWWQVEQHGSWANTDEATGSGGFQDSFSATRDSPSGPKRGPGSFSMSYRSAFTTAP